MAFTIPTCSWDLILVTIKFPIWLTSLSSLSEFTLKVLIAVESKLCAQSTGLKDFCDLVFLEGF